MTRKKKNQSVFVVCKLNFTVGTGDKEANRDGTVSGEAHSPVPLTLKSELQLQLPEQALLHKVPEM